MSRFFNVRGFIDCDYGDLKAIRGIVESYEGRAAEFGLDGEVVHLYLSGWMYQVREINWISHAFFGASMRAGGVNLLLDQLSCIARSSAEIEGVFFVDDDEGCESREWNISDGCVEVIDRRPR
ncbi:hypothetical protein [Kitasatospora sp. NPDC006786]|uniref:hypothetical protein n=1 Tax=unclassified Kitasatospora TaxID=2633591 RepID=UPI0033C700F9